MDRSTLHVVVRAARESDGAAGAATGSLLRPDHEAFRVWRDAADPALLRDSFDCSADDLDGALALGRQLADETVAEGPSDAAVEEVVAMDEVQQLVWRSRGPGSARAPSQSRPRP